MLCKTLNLPVQPPLSVLGLVAAIVSSAFPSCLMLHQQAAQTEEQLLCWWQVGYALLLQLLLLKAVQMKLAELETPCYAHNVGGYKLCIEVHTIQGLWPCGYNAQSTGAHHAGLASIWSVCVSACGANNGKNCWIPTWCCVMMTQTSFIPRNLR